ncbi:MAG: nucleotide sugar dehydrogenase, partial [Actinomycetota bacterium]|nr:nucleotide sugar dehydrogenase [Actinomycetota bacterium]
IPIYEPGLADSIARHRDRLHFSTELAPALEHARLLFVAVGTPPTYSGDADLSAVNAVVAAMPASDHHALVMKSTVPVGTGTSIKRMFAEQGKSGFAYVSCPEFLKEGSALEDFLHPDRVVVGDDGDWAGDAVVEVYSPLQAPLVRTDIASAEMVKLAANAFLATKISFINEIANVCEETGADVLEVARGMGLDRRIGSHFLRPGIGYGGSCFVPEETVLVRHRGRTTLMSFEQLWRRLESEYEQVDGVIEPDEVKVLSWVPGQEEPIFLSVLCVTRREYHGDIVEVRAKTGRRVSCTPDHPWLASDGLGSEPERKLAAELTSADWLPIAMGGGREWEATGTASLLCAVEAAEISPERLIVRGTLRPEEAEQAVRRGIRGAGERDTGTWSRNVPVSCVSRPGSVIPSGTHPRSVISLDRDFWRVVGLYVAVGSRRTDGCAIMWTFDPTREQHLVDDVMAYWLRHNVEARVRDTPTSSLVDVRSRILAAWWTQVLGLGPTSYQQRLPDLIWDRPSTDKWALLSGLFEGDGSWSLVNGGPSVIIELGTISDELADGVTRLLASVGIVASRRIGRRAKSTMDTHWIRIADADQVERAIQLVPERNRPGVLASIALQRKRIAPTGYRRFGDGPVWVRVASTERRPYAGPVYSLEVPYSHTVVAQTSLIASNCFPKDVSALKQLAGNSGYHFQLLTAVIEVNELQKRRVMSKLQKHLGSLVGTTVALLGVAFKPETDDMREASSLVLAARLQADGARVQAYDPVAADEARTLMLGVDFAASPVEAIDGADAVVLVTEWPVFGELDFAEVAERMRGNVVVDGRNFFDRASVEEAGLTYEGIGR